MAKEEELQKRYIEMQLIEQQIRELQKQVQRIDNSLIELVIADQALEDLKSTKIGTEILVPISGGIFVKADLKDNKDLIVNVGSDITVKKDVDSTKGLLQKQTGEIEKTRMELLTTMQNLGEQAQKIQLEMQELMR